MATFKVGQRVRIVHSPSWPQMLGRTATVIGSLIDGWCAALGEYQGYPLNIDGHGTKAKDGYSQCGAHPSWLEPIIDTGRTVTEWDIATCPWVPEHLREKREHHESESLGLTK